MDTSSSISRFASVSAPKFRCFDPTISKPAPANHRRYPPMSNGAPAPDSSNPVPDRKVVPETDSLSSIIYWYGAAQFGRWKSTDGGREISIVHHVRSVLP
ncbi:hypothetical protein CRG98_003629 [Punica granatum]|uniref:Uncharacterized protein n=1 Tax=Punica granatum TaxID=22663 RepID=A0A2I0L5H6_PUNGR|nr:hypothetical protein CRG98_003629 [Punica granatum]